MTSTTPNWHPFDRTRADDDAILTAGGETGWWDDHGRPAPWPNDFLDPDTGWTGPDTDTVVTSTPHDNDPANPPF